MDLFADRLGDVTIADGVIRMDFLRIKEVKEEQARLEPAFRVAISIDGALQSITVLEQVKKELLNQVKKNT